MGLPFFKYTSFGNNFVILDEHAEPLLTESEKQTFAHLATDQNFGIGCDNFLVIQPCTRQVLERINHCHHYWEKIPDPGQAEYVFRMFEPDGTEAFSCGNGLMCIADHLFMQSGIQSARIMTEIPTSGPKSISIGRESGSGLSWANMGHPRQVPSHMADPEFRTPLDETVDIVAKIEFDRSRESDSGLFFNNQTSVAATGYLVFTGEPHLVIFVETGFSIPEPARIIFPGVSQTDVLHAHFEKRRSTSAELVHFIGSYFARIYGNVFPAGMNINFVRHLKEKNVLEYRCFERGINRETLACGTGALATAFVAERLNLVTGDTITLWPHRCRWHDHDAEIVIKKGPGGWVLNGRPSKVYEGVFTSKEFQAERLLPIHPREIPSPGWMQQHGCRLTNYSSLATV